MLILSLYSTLCRAIRRLRQQAAQPVPAAVDSTTAQWLVMDRGNTGA